MSQLQTFRYRGFWASYDSVPVPLPTFPIIRVVSMGRRNTQLEPTLN